MFGGNDRVASRVGGCRLDVVVMIRSGKIMRGSLQLLAIGLLLCLWLWLCLRAGQGRGSRFCYLSSPSDIPYSALEKSFVFEPYWVIYAVLNESLVQREIVMGLPTIHIPNYKKHWSSWELFLTSLTPQKIHFLMRHAAVLNIKTAHMDPSHEILLSDRGYYFDIMTFHWACFDFHLGVICSTGYMTAVPNSIIMTSPQWVPLVEGLGKFVEILLGVWHSI